MATRIKGASLINTVAIVRELVGSTRFEDLISKCPPETQQLLRRTLIAVEWVPLELWAPFIRVIFERICRSDEAQFRRVMRAVCKRDFTTVYRAYLGNAAPLDLLRKAPNIWSAYFDSGSLNLVSENAEDGPISGTDTGPGVVKLEMLNLETPHNMFAMAMHAYLEQLMVMTGAPNCVVQRTRERLVHGKLSCEFFVSFGA